MVYVILVGPKSNNSLIFSMTSNIITEVFSLTLPIIPSKNDYKPYDITHCNTKSYKYIMIIEKPTSS